MNYRMLTTGWGLFRFAGALLALVLIGCSTTSSVNWNERVGTYSWDDALTELGDPDRVSEEEGGVRTAEWVKDRSVGLRSATDTPSYVRGESLQPRQTYGSSAPPKVLRLSFTPDGKLFDWDRNY